MKCHRCQAQNREGAQFCRECGTRFGAVCPACGAKVEPGSKFCDSCGATLSDVPAPAAAPSRFAAPESYTPKHLAEKILTSKSALEGERKQLTVLFADLKGSMELLVDRDPEDARKLLDPVLERMMEAVHRYEGTVNQVMGDGIMALFGAPLAHEDHAVRACYAALRMQEAVKRYAEEMRRAVGVPIQIRVGLNSGEVVVRSIGSDLHMDYTAVGQTTHLAARMEQAAVPGSIVIPAETLRLAEGFVQVKPLGPVPVKGLEVPIEVYEIIGAGPVRRRLEAAVARGLTRFVGRDAELDQLRRALEQATQGHGQVVGVVGEPGVGKSRLFYEFTHSHRMHGWLILESGSVSYGKATTYLPVIDLLKAYFQIETRDDERKIREKVSGKLVTLDQALMPTLPAVLTLLDVPVEDPRWQDLDPAQRRQRTLDAVKRLLLRESQVQPLCLVLEDLHWIDSETQVVLDSLIASLPTARLLLLVNYRPEYQHGWGSKTYYTQLRIDPLPPESAEELLQALLGIDPGLQPLKQLLIERTEGNPFFLEESVRTLVETQALMGERGAYRLAKPVQTIQVPAAVQAVLAARIDRLPPEDKRLLQSASVIGETVPFALLQAVVEMPEEELRRALSRLQTVEFLYETSLFPDLEYTFKHALTYQVAYDSLLQERRRLLHARIVEAIERLYPDRLAEQVDRLAQHAFRGEVWDKALHYFRRAGEKAVGRSANHEAVTLLDQALGVVAQLPETRETLSEVLDVQLARGAALLPLRSAAAPEVERCYARAQELAERLEDRSRLFPAVWGRWFVAFMSEQCRAAAELADRVFAIARAGDDSARLLEGHHSLWGTLVLMGRLAEGCAHADQGIALYDRRVHHASLLLYGGHDPGVCARFCSAWMLWDLGYPDQALRRMQEAERLARELSHPVTVAAAIAFAAHLHDRLGEIEFALEKARALEELARLHAFGPVWIETSAVLTGRLLVKQGRHDEGLARLVRGLPAMRGWRYMPSVCFLAESYGEAGEPSKGLEAIAEGMASAERNALGYHLSELFRLRGELLAATGGASADAVASVRHALEIARRQQARSLELRAAMSLTRLLTGQGRRDEARTALAEAYGWFTEGLETADMRNARALLSQLS